jgi:hypothetical protein
VHAELDAAFGRKAQYKINFQNLFAAADKTAHATAAELADMPYLECCIKGVSINRSYFWSNLQNLCD